MKVPGRANRLVLANHSNPMDPNTAIVDTGNGVDEGSRIVDEDNRIVAEGNGIVDGGNRTDGGREQAVGKTQEGEKQTGGSIQFDCGISAEWSSHTVGEEIQAVGEEIQVVCHCSNIGRLLNWHLG